jgi:hypothetical protein
MKSSYRILYEFLVPTVASSDSFVIKQFESLLDRVQDDPESTVLILEGAETSHFFKVPTFSALSISTLLVHVLYRLRIKHPGHETVYLPDRV